MSCLNVWVRASRTVIVVVVLCMMVSCGIVRGSSHGGGSGTLTVSGAPASVGGTFVVDGDETEHRRKGANATVQWAEARGDGDPHSESIVVEFDRATNRIVQLSMAASDGFAYTVWTCGGPASANFVACNGATMNRAGGTLTLANTSLGAEAKAVVQAGGTVQQAASGQIALNGTLSFKPF